MNKNVILIFPSRQKLFAFKGLVMSCNVGMDVLYKSALLLCNCSDEEIELAIHSYEAHELNYADKMFLTRTAGK